MKTFLTATVIALAIVASAADTNSVGPDLVDLSLEQLATVKVATVYGASMHDQTLAEAPSDVTIVTAEQIHQYGYRTLGEILDSVRGFYTTSDGVYDYVGTRGFNRPGDYGGRILITIDGHRMNDDIFNSAAIGTEFLLDVDLIERVEVIRGPGSSLYGDNAVFAVINVITRRGRDVHGAEMAGSYGSYDQWTGRFTYGNRFTNGVEMMLSGTYLGRDGNDHVYYPYFASINRGYAQDNQAAAAPSALATVSYKDFSIEGGVVNRREITPTGPYGSVFNNPHDVEVDNRAFADVKFDHRFDSELDLMARLYYDHYKYDGDYPLSEFPYGTALYPGAIYINQDRDDQESLGAETRVSKVVFERHRLTAGVEYRRDFILQQLNYNVGGPTFLSSNPTEYTMGIYAQDEYSILRNLILNAGGRYDYFSTFGGGRFDPRAALIYTPWTNSTFKAIYGQALRAPDAFELYYVAPGYSADTRLKPEVIHSYELDYSQILSPRLQLVSSVFYDEIDDLISFGTDSSGNAIFGNIAGATSLGGEIELDANWGKGWKGAISYTYADTRDSATKQWLTDSPHDLAKLTLTAPIWTDKLSANLELLGMSDRTTMAGNTLAPYWLANFTLLSRQIARNLEVSASIYNLFDRKYSDPVGSDFPADSVQQYGRRFRVKLIYRF